MSSPQSPFYARVVERAQSEFLAKPIETTAKVTVAIFIPMGLAVTNVMVSRYLALFEQPGLSSGDIGLLGATVPMAVIITALFVGYMALPLLSRSCVAAHPTAFATALAWPVGRRRGRLQSLSAFVCLYAPLYVACAWVAATLALSPWVTSAHLVWGALGVGTIPPLAFAWRRRGVAGRGLDFAIEAALLSLAVSFLSFVWLLTWMLVSPQYLLPALQELSDSQGAAVGVALAVALILVHWLMHVVAGRRGVVVFCGLLLGVALTVLPGDRLVTYNALRFAQIGGGVPIALPAAIGDEAAPQHACLILRTTSAQIVLRAKAPSDCDDEKMRKVFWGLVEAEPDERAALLTALRVVPKG